MATVLIDLANFELHNALRCGIDLRALARESASLEAVARGVVRYFYQHCADEATGQPTCVLARFYRTVAYANLPPELRVFADRHVVGRPHAASTKCLALLASAGTRPEWNDRRLSQAHQAIPLPSAEIIERTPMIAQLIRQMGLDIAQVVAPSPDVLRHDDGRTYDVFHVERALGSAYIPAQKEFVEPYGVRSVVGFGGMDRGSFFAVILFAAVTIGPPSANRFRKIALDLKAALHEFPADQVFESSSVRQQGNENPPR